MTKLVSCRVCNTKLASDYTEGCPNCMTKDPIKKKRWKYLREVAAAAVITGTISYFAVDSFEINKADEVLIERLTKALS